MSVYVYCAQDAAASDKARSLRAHCLLQVILLHRLWCSCLRSACVCYTLAVLQKQQWCRSVWTRALSIVLYCSVRIVDVNSPRLMKSLLQKPLGGAFCCSSLNRVLSTYGKSCDATAGERGAAGLLAHPDLEIVCQCLLYAQHLGSRINSKLGELPCSERECCV